MSKRLIAFAVSMILLFTFGSIPVSAFSSSSNVYVGISPSECSAEDNPTVWLTFNQTMTTTVSSGDQWSAQTNSYTLSNSAGIKWMQFNMAINSAGQIYGAVEYWTSLTTSVYNVHTSTLATVTHVSSGDQFVITIYEDDGYYSNQLWAVNFYYYQKSSGNSWSQDIFPPSQYYAQIASWQLNIVGENSLSNPSATFTSGGGETEYYSLTSASTWVAVQPTCVQAQGWVTYETSNMQYAVPTTSCITTCVLQGFKY